MSELNYKKTELLNNTVNWVLRNSATSCEEDEKLTPEWWNIISSRKNKLELALGAPVQTFLSGELLYSYFIPGEQLIAQEKNDKSPTE